MFLWLFLLVFVSLLQTDALAQMTLKSAAQVSVQQLVSVSYRFSFEVPLGFGPGGARDYVGLYPIVANATPVRQAWMYLDGTTGVAAATIHKAAKTGPTGGVVTFDLNDGVYEARFYVNGSELPTDLKSTIRFTVGPPVAEMIYDVDDAAKFDRVSLSTSKDQITVTHSYGGKEIITVNKDVRFYLSKVGATGTAPPFFSVDTVKPTVFGVP